MKIMKKIKSIAVIAILITLSACAEDEPTRLTNVSGLIPDLSFELIDEDNKVVTASDYHGYTCLLYTSDAADE